jgi:hypothetical protein
LAQAVLKVSLIIWACMAPGWQNCSHVKTLDMTAAGPVRCELNRPVVAHITQEYLFDGWYPFTECRVMDLGEENEQRQHRRREEPVGSNPEWPPTREER